jgi:hypothetical protein
MAPPSRPPFTDLPLDKNGPPCNAWGLYGKDDELGALNMITPDTVKTAAQEIQTGQRVSLDWYLNLPSFPSFGRPPFGWKMENRSHPDGTKRIVNDDHLDINTQSSSQWDGLRHYGYQQAKRYYNNRSQQDVEGSEVIGIDRVAHYGGITARGVILDYPRYLEAKGQEPVNALTASHISADVLKDMLHETGVKTKPGVYSSSEQALHAITPPFPPPTAKLWPPNPLLSWASNPIPTSRSGSGILASSPSRAMLRASKCRRWLARTTSPGVFGKARVGKKRCKVGGCCISGCWAVGVL